MNLTSSRITLDADAESVFEYLLGNGYSDGLPVIPPTKERVLRMLTGTPRAPDESLGDVPPALLPATIEKIAVNAVMAGCTPHYLPVLIAAMELMLEPKWMLDALQSTTNPLTPMVLLNGPIRNAIGLHSGTGVMGPGWRANATIGRAIRLILLNLGGAIPGDVDKCTQGFVGKYTLCMGENEEESPWEPFHVNKGFQPDDSVVTVVGVNSSTNVHDSSDRWEDLLKTLTASLISPGTANVVDPYSTPVIALNPMHAQILSSAGFTRERLQAHLFDHCRLPADALSNRRAALRRGEHGGDHFLVDGQIPFTNRPEQIQLFVTGGMSGGHSCYLSNGHYGYLTSKRLPKADQTAR